MATFTDKLRILLDWDGKDAETGLKGFVTKVREADGVSGKLKAGFAGVKDSITQNAGALAATAGASLLAFGVKAVGAFTDTAKAAIDLGKATALSTEEASRWIAVADDYEVTAEDLETGLGQIAKRLDTAPWEKYGIATRDAGGNARSVNDILIDTLDMLGRTSNETERARIASELLGRGWANIAPIIGHTRSEYEDMLGSVEKGQVITAKEAQKAEKWRLAMDRLQDTLGEVTLAVGEAVSEMAPMIDRLSDTIAAAQGLNDKFNVVQRGADALDLSNPINLLARLNDDEFANTGEVFGTLADGFAEAAQAMRVGADDRAEYYQSRERAAAADTSAADAAKASARAVDALNGVLEDQADAYRAAYDGARKYEGKSLDLQEATLDLADQFAETTDILNDSKSTDEDKQRAMIALRRAQMDVVDSIKDTALAYAQSQGATDGSRASYMLQIDALERMKAQYPELAGEIDLYIAALKKIPGVVNTNVTWNGRVPVAPTSGAVGDTGNIDTGNTGGGRGTGRVNSVGLSRSDAAPTLNVNVAVNGVVTGTQVGQQIADALTGWWNDGGRAAWMGS